MVTFQQAYEAAAARYAPEVWGDLSPGLRIRAIYEEMRRLDSEAAAVIDNAHTIPRKPRADQERLEHVITGPERRSARNIEHQKIDRPRVARKRRIKRTPQAMGRRLLEIVVYAKGCRFGGTLSLDDLAETPEVGDWKMPDFKAACSYAASQGWLIVQDNALTLTAAGLAASSKPA